MAAGDIDVNVCFVSSRDDMISIPIGFITGTPAEEPGSGPDWTYPDKDQQLIPLLRAAADALEGLTP